MIEAKIHGFFKQRCEVVMDGTPLTTMEFTRREGSAFGLNGEPYVISRPRRKEFALAGAGGALAGAVLHRSRNWTISAGAEQVDVVKPKLFGQEWQVHAGGRQIGVIRKRGMFDRTVETIIEPQLPLPMQLFALYLVLVLLRRQQAAAASNSGGAGGS